MNLHCRSNVSSAALLCAFLALPASAWSADVDPDETAPVVAPGWIVQVTPYIWATGISGDVSPFRLAPTIHVDESFSDVLKSLEGGGFLDVWARRDSFVLSGNLMYVNTSEAKSVGILPDLFPGGLEIGAELDTVLFNATLQGGYRVIDSPGFTFDLMAGGRYWYVSNEVTVSLDNLDVIKIEKDLNWIDPLAGVRAFYSINDKLSLMGQADIGGFGVGSEMTWSALGTVNYVFNEHFSVSAGYKHLEVNYEDDGYVFDTTFSGPVLGVTYRFN